MWILNPKTWLKDRAADSLTSEASRKFEDLGITSGNLLLILPNKAPLTLKHCEL